MAEQLNTLASLLIDTDRLVEAEPLMRRALAISEKNLGTDHIATGIYYNNLAHLLDRTGRLLEAETFMRRSLEILRKFAQQTGRQHRFWHNAVQYYAEILSKMGLTGDQISVGLNDIA